MRKLSISLVILASFAFSACKKEEKAAAPKAAADAAPKKEMTPPPAAADAAPAAAEKSLYDRLGGKEAITKVIDDLVANVVADDKINKRFAKADVPHLKAMLVDQVCEATGGPCKYQGKSMPDAHKGMKITEEEFNALVGDLVKALDKNGVGEKEKGELLGALGGMKGDIVGK